jgi:flagellar biosynthetic protein FliQ
MSMTDQAVIEIGRSAFMTGLMLAAPPLLVALLVGLVVSIIQSVTQLNEATLTFVPKMLAVFAALLLCGPWMIRIMVAYTSNLFALIPHLAH